MRLMLGHMFAHPGKKMLFMGSEFAQPEEWDHDAELNWEVGGTPLHAGIRQLGAGAERALPPVPCTVERWF